MTRVHKVAKLIIVDNNEKYLMMYRSNHPEFGNDPDLPGGTLEEGEVPLQTMLREVEEEAGITVDQILVKELYSGAEFSAHGTEYILFITTLDIRPEIVISWEHASYEWIDKDSFITVSGLANDTYMHMVHDVMKRISI